MTWFWAKQHKTNLVHINVNSNRKKFGTKISFISFKLLIRIELMTLLGSRQRWERVCDERWSSANAFDSLNWRQAALTCADACFWPRSCRCFRGCVADAVRVKRWSWAEVECDSRVHAFWWHEASAAASQNRSGSLLKNQFLFF